jgi:hypothetical protein
MRLRQTAMRAVIGWVTLAVTLSLCSCTGGSGIDNPNPSPVKWTRDLRYGISVSHPAEWRLSKFDEVSSFSTAVMFLSNRDLEPPCTTSADGSRTHCRGLPRTQLDDDGVLIEWYSYGFPEPEGYNPLARISGDDATIDGHRAKVTETDATGQCSSIGGTRQITATIWTGPGADTLGMIACLSNPSTEVRQQVLTSLRTLRA